MICRQCGTEIADKALICYRCGTATTEAKYKPVDLKARRTSSLTALVVFLVLALVGAYLAATSTNDTIRIVGAAVVLVSVVMGTRRWLTGRR
jgi:uncharacterized membrane protein YvbJ